MKRENWTGIYAYVMIIYVMFSQPPAIFRSRDFLSSLWPSVSYPSVDLSSKTSLFSLEPDPSDQISNIHNILWKFWVFFSQVCCPLHELPLPLAHFETGLFFLWCTVKINFNACFSLDESKYSRFLFFF